MIEQILVVAGITFLIMISPGPDMVIVMRNTIIGGRAAGLKSSLGVLCGNMVHISYCAIGIGWLISQSIVAFSILKYAGAAYLIYLGVMSFRAAGTFPEESDVLESKSSNNWFLQGFANNILNPKGTLFYLGLFTMVITPSTSTPVMLLLVIVTLFVSALFWLFFVYTLDSGFVRCILRKSQELVNKFLGGVLIFLGVRVAVMDR